MKKSELLKLSMELDEALARIEQGMTEHRSTVIQKDGFVYSFGSTVDKFREKLDLFRRDVNKFADILPTTRKRRSGKNKMQ